MIAPHLRDDTSGLSRSPREELTTSREAILPIIGHRMVILLPQASFAAKFRQHILYSPHADAINEGPPVEDQCTILHRPQQRCCNEHTSMLSAASATQSRDGKPCILRELTYRQLQTYPCLEFYLPYGPTVNYVQGCMIITCSVQKGAHGGVRDSTTLSGYGLTYQHPNPPLSDQIRYELTVGPPI